MNNKTDPAQQRRVILAVVLSFLFFIVYSEFFIDKKIMSEQNASLSQNASVADSNANLAVNSNANSAPDLATNSKAAPLSNADTQAPITQSAYQHKALVSISSEYFSAKIDELGRISSFVLKDAKFKDEKGADLELIENKDNKPLPLELRFSNPAINQKAFSTAYSVDLDTTSEIKVGKNAPLTLTLTQNLGELVVQKKLKFYEQGNYEIEVNLSKDEPYFISAGSRPSVSVDNYTVHGALIVDTKDTVETFEDGDVEQNEQRMAFLLSSFDRYYAAFFYNFATPLNALITKDAKGDSVVYASASNAFKAGGYIGAKEFDTLKAIDTRLERVIEYGWFTFIAKPAFAFLSWLFAYIGNWGWAIVVLSRLLYASFCSRLLTNR